MLALNLVQGKCVRYNRCLYFRMKENIFVGNRPYPTEGLESLLREEFGDTPVMTDILDVRYADKSSVKKYLLLNNFTIVFFY